MNPVKGAMVINKGGGGGEAPQRKPKVDSKANRELSAAPKGSAGWETVKWQEMTPGQREEMTGAITEGNVFVPRSKQTFGCKRSSHGQAMRRLERERIAIMGNTAENNKEKKYAPTLKGDAVDWRAMSLAASAARSNAS
tara:strand:+ start:155 stop:571 length:417 start_codon:yes stop_codon:yes gene_type:complete